MFSVGDTVITKKAHPCGGNRWTVIRMGADVKIRCEQCGRIVMLPLDEFKKRVKKHIPADQPKGEA